VIVSDSFGPSVSSTGIHPPKATAGNVCDDKRCSGGERRYYLTQNSGFFGNQATTACASGYHMAAMSELSDRGLVYNTILGVTRADSGEGGPSIAQGWVRTGYISLGTSGSPEFTNCRAWTSSAGGDTGVVVMQTVFPPAIGGTVLPSGSPWSAISVSCGSQYPVWCVED
jgi:hypothetical protein